MFIIYKKSIKLDHIIKDLNFKKARKRKNTSQKQDKNDQ